MLIFNTYWVLFALAGTVWLYGSLRGRRHAI
jgi:hypothetical protein